MTHPIQPWASTDHDPSSNTESITNSGEIHTTTQTLAFARADIHTAVGAHDDAHRRRQYAQSALSYANTVLLTGRHPTSSAGTPVLPGGRAGDDRRRVSRQPPPAGARPRGAAPAAWRVPSATARCPAAATVPADPLLRAARPQPCGAQSLSRDCPC